MRKTIFSIYLLSSLMISAQSPQTEKGKSYVGNINEMFPAAPTSNNLMKFEEVPVSYYTGIPDINIPLLTISTSNKNVNVDVQLRYHPLNAKPDDRSGETGLGWSLTAGGTISRTVRGGGPDEKDRTIDIFPPQKFKFGIYNQLYNPTYKILNNATSANLNDYTYSFDAGMGKFDTEYDLYQYNFMDKSGRFYVIKNADGNYTAEKLDKNNLQIICNKDANTGIIISFTIVDDKGVRYIFNAMETSQKDISNVKTGLTMGTGELISNLEIGDYYTSFHLVTINDQSDTSLVEFKYDLSSQVKFIETPITTKRLAKNVNYVNLTGGPINSDGSLPGAFERQLVSNISETRLLTRINVTGKGTVYLNYEQGRQDSNYTEPTSLYKLKSIQANYLGQSVSQYVDKYIFDYDYTNTHFQTYDGNQLLKKMLLKKVTKISPNNQNFEYLLEYNTNSSTLKKDDWGYYKAVGISTGNDLVTDVIKSITYPTKGKITFNFDENEYSYHPTTSNVMTPVTGYNVNNNFDSSINFSQFSDTYKKQFFTIQSAQTVNLDLLLGNLIYFNWQFKLYKKNADNTFSPAVYQFGYPAQTCNKYQPSDCMILNPTPDGQVISEFHPNIHLEPGAYYASLSGDFGPSNPAQTTDNFIAHTTETSYVDVKIYKGGGIRIRNIVFFENPASSVALKKYVYNYNNINDTQRSSGALVFPEPVFKLVNYYTYQNRYNNPTIQYSADFDITTDYNMLPVQKTQGADVGYKYVAVEQMDLNNNKKGKIVYQFRSPIDYPNEAVITVQLPSIPIPNQDYLRGQLISEKKYDSKNNLISEATIDYITSAYEKNDGIKIKDNYSNNMISELYSFGDYQQMVNHIGTSVALTTPYRKFEKFGMTLPSQRIEKSYFYTNGVQSLVSSMTKNTYNMNDYPSLIVQQFPDTSSTATLFQYAHEKGNQKLINANMIGIPLQTTMVKKQNANDSNGKIISKTETKYDDPATLFPTSVLSYDLENPGTSTTEVTYDKYDSKGNLQQYTTKDGVSTTIIWGYNSTKPIAKIENVKLAEISVSVITAMVGASDTDAAAGANNDETTLWNAFKIFRNGLPGYKITTYSYDPLVGVRSITPPSGIRENYTYDSAGRLEKVIDMNGKVLKEMKYNYKN